MNKKPISEELFESFCADNKILCLPIPRSPVKKIKTPDYEIIINGKSMVVEVKQLDHNKDDENHERQLKKDRITDLHEDKVANRIREKIHQARLQLNNWENKETPFLIVLYSNLLLDGRYIEPHLFLEAMYGEDTFIIHLPNNYSNQPIVTNHLFGGGRKVTPANNTSLSAIVSLFEDWDQHKLHAYFYHNIFSRCKFDPDWFRQKRVKHFSLPNTNMDEFSEWVEI